MKSKKKCFRRQIFRRPYWYIVISIILLLVMYVPCMAHTPEIFEASQEDLDIIFVVDYSNSMNGNDRYKIGLEMIEAFIDEAFSKKMRVGYVAYNHQILASQKPISLSEKNNRKQLKTAMRNIKRLGSTDIGLALKEAQSLLSAEDSRQSLIILISDGEPDLSYVQTGRTVNDSYKDMKKVAIACKEMSVPIYTIALGKNFDGKVEAVKQLSDLSGGYSYTVQEPSDLVEIFNTILSQYTTASVVPIASSMASGALQTIDIPFESDYVSEANILLVSSTPIHEANVLYSGTEVEMSNSTYYFTCKIKQPQNNKLKLQYRASSGEYVKVYFILYQDLRLEVALNTPVSKNKETLVKAYLVDCETNTPIKEAAFYDSFKSNMVMTDSAKAQTSVALTFKDDHLQGNMKLKTPGDYKMQCQVNSAHYKAVIDDIKFACVNDAPQGQWVLEENYPHELVKTIKIPLGESFTDPNGDEITYEIQAVDGDTSQCSIEGDTLLLQPHKLGKIAFQLVAKDTEGLKNISPISTLTIVPIWRYYIGVTVAVVLVILILVTIIILYYMRLRSRRPKPEYSGKLNVYFTKAPEDIEIEPLCFSLFQMTGKKITLAELLEGAGLDIPELYGDKVYFEPAFDREIYFCHMTDHAVMLGTSIACRKLKYSIAYGTKIYITLADESYDLEIHYVSARS